MHKFPDIFNYIIENNVKGVLIDFDDTIYKFTPVTKQAIIDCSEHFIANHHDITITAEQFVKKYRDHRNALFAQHPTDVIFHSRFLIFQALFSELGLANAYVHAHEYEKIHWQIFVNLCQPDPHAVNFLKKCQNNQIAVCLLTNMEREPQIQKLQKMKIIQYIPYFACSQDVGIEKPASQIFEYALNKLNLQKNQVIMVGDSTDHDIAGAENLGIQSFLVDLYN